MKRLISRLYNIELFPRQGHMGSQMMLRQVTGCQRRAGWRACYRYFSSSKSETNTEGEKKIINALKSRFPGQTYLDVADISGGCGAMFEVSIEAEEFRGLRTVKQHMLVNEALKEEIEQMHGLRINTKVPG